MNFIKKNPLLAAVILGAIFEAGEIIHGSCTVWAQEYALLAAFAILSLTLKNYRWNFLITALIIVVFYFSEAYDMYWNGEICGNAASELNPLLGALLVFSALSWKKK
jgi:4-hydroxybenzoate polyprenyltransferase